MEFSGPYAGAAAALAGTPFHRVRYVETTGSTNADAAALLGDERSAGLTIVAEWQTEGAGRKGRSWIAPAGSALLFTTILPIPLASAYLWAVPFWTAVAVQRGLRDRGIEAGVTWPNDLLLEGGKVAGILCTSRVAGDVAWAACGVGINVFRNKADAGAIDPPPAFCDDAAPVEREALLRSILAQYDAALTLLENPQRVARTWERAARLPGPRYRILKDGSTVSFEAEALSLATGGGLTVRRADGTKEVIALADARVLRSNRLLHDPAESDAGGR
jgi:BirA family biotin operon repressor/biotin-[acetyl-CoA-carboxylase] ligase